MVRDPSSNEKRDEKALADDAHRAAALIRATLYVSFLGPWLGNGRATEMYLTFVALFTGYNLTINPKAAFESQATYDIAWLGYGQWLGAGFIAIGTLQGVGLLLNVLGWRHSVPLRISGAWLAVLVWSFICAKFGLLGSTGAVGFPHTFADVLFSTRALVMACCGYPRPGSPGLI